MILINLSHELSEKHVAQIEVLLNPPPASTLKKFIQSILPGLGETNQERKTIRAVVEVAVKFDDRLAYPPQVKVVMDKIPLTPQQLQVETILVNLPALNTIAALLLAELHGRMGYFPPVLRWRRVEEENTSRFEVAEIINLQNIRDEARNKRYEPDSA